MFSAEAVVAGVREAASLWKDLVAERGLRKRKFCMLPLAAS